MSDQSMHDYVADMVTRAHVAQAAYEEMGSQELFDKAARAVCKITYDNAEMFSKEAAEETNIGTAEDKIAKHKAMLGIQWFYMKDKKSTGIIGWEQGKLDVDCILKIAKPAGVVGSVLPSTNPTVTLAANATQAMKCGNALICCPHPRALKVSMHLVELLRSTIAELGLPEDLIQCVDPEHGSIEATAEVMAQVDLVVATGGAGMVKAANSSGNPSFGVGQGNCQVIVDRGMVARYDEMAKLMIPNRALDNAVMCIGEQFFIIPEEDEEAFTEAFNANGAYVITDQADVDKIREATFVPNKAGVLVLNPKLAGRPVQEIAEAAGVEVPKGTKLIITKVNEYAENEQLAREKLFPVSGLYTYSGTFEEAIDVAVANLKMEGAGHSSVVWTDDEERQRYAGLTLPVCRVCVNNGNAAVGGGPYYETGTVVTSGVGCGFWQKNIITRNLDFTDLLNYTRLIYKIPNDRPDPTEEEIWAE